MNSPSRFLSVSLFVGALLLGGCAVGPDYRAPELPVKVSPFAVTQAAASTPELPWWNRSDPALSVLVERALVGNRDLRVAEATLREARALRQESRSAFLPTATVSGGYRRQLDSTLFFKGVPRDQRDQNIFDVGVDSSWELDLFGRVRRAVEAGAALTGAAEADLVQLRVLIASETARAYVELATVQQAISLQEKLADHQHELVNLLQLQVETGKASREKLGPAEVDLTVFRSSLRDLRLSERALRNRLGVLMGGSGLPATQSVAMPVIPSPQLSGDSVRLLTSRPDVQAAERRLAASTAAIGVARADYFPSLSLVARVGAESSQLGKLDSADANLFALGPRLQWDLLSLHRTRARVQAAEARREQAFDAWENTVLLALEEIDNALASADEASLRLNDWKRAVGAAGESLRIARLRGEQGVLSPFELHQAEQAFLQAQLAYLRAQAELANATIFLQKSLAIDR